MSKSIVQINWIFVSLLLMGVFILTFKKTPAEITMSLEELSASIKTYSAMVHILFLIMFITGLLYGRFSKIIFTSMIALLSISATVIAAVYFILPNIIIFSLFTLLIIRAHRTKKLNFELKKNTRINTLFGIIGLISGFYYLHWVGSPVILNALLFSPLGAANCPTMVMICGFLCITVKPRSVLLETVVSFVTLYFGFFGIFRLGAYVDVMLIACSLFIILRMGSYLNFDGKP